MKRALLLALALGACSTAPDMAHDYAGNVYPVDCPASITTDAALLSRVVIVRQHVSGTNGTTRGTIITLDPSLSGWILEDVTRHELCHAKHWLKNGNPDWHARHVPNIYRAPTCANPFHC